MEARPAEIHQKAVQQASAKAGKNRAEVCGMTDITDNIIRAGRKIETLERQLRGLNPDSPMGRNLKKRIEAMKDFRTLCRSMARPQTEEGKCLMM